MRRRGAGVAAFGAVLNVYPAMVISVAAYPWQTSNDDLTQAHASGSCQQETIAAAGK